MELGLKNASYATNIQNVATRNLVNQIRKQQNAIDILNLANQKYSLQEERNNLAIEKIQYSAMSRHGRLTRYQKKQIEELEKANMQLRINTEENQIKIGEAQMDLSPLEKRYDETKMWYAEELRLVQDTYQREYDALKNTLDAQLAILQSYYITRNEMQRNVINAQNLQTSVEDRARRSGKLVILGSRQSGGYIPTTGAYLLHAGETVTPANKTVNNERNVRIDVNAKIYNYGNIPDLANKIARAVAAGYITGVESKFTVG